MGACAPVYIYKLLWFLQTHAQQPRLRIHCEVSRLVGSVAPHNLRQQTLVFHRLLLCSHAHTHAHRRSRANDRMNQLLTSVLMILELLQVCSIQAGEAGKGNLFSNVADGVVLVAVEINAHLAGVCSSRTSQHAVTRLARGWLSRQTHHELRRLGSLWSPVSGLLAFHGARRP